MDLPGDGAASILRGQRRVALTGALDGDAADRACLELMALDGESPAPVRLTLNSRGGPVGAAFAVLDVIGLMRAPVEVTVVGTASGTPAAVLACATGPRRVAPHATISLRVRHAGSAGGTAADLAVEADRFAAERRSLVSALATATGQDRGRVEAELDGGGVMDAPSAVAFGLADEVAAGDR